MQYTFSLSRRSLPVRCLCLLLIVVVLLCFFLTPRASAVALEAATVAYGGLLIGTILVGAGVIFSSHGDMVKVGNAMAKSFIDGSNAIWSKISAISSWAVEHGEAAAKGALRVGKELYQEIVDAFNASYSDGTFWSSGNAITVDVSNIDSDVLNEFNMRRYSTVTVMGDSGLWRFQAVRLGVNSDGIYQYTFKGMCSDGSVADINGLYGAGYSVSLWVDFDSYTKRPQISVVGWNSAGTGWYSGSHSYEFHAPKPTTITGFAGIDVVSGDLVYPSDDYLVKMPDLPAVDEVTGDVTYPSDAAYTKDAIAVSYPVDAEGVKVPDIPYDQVVDQSTGKALDDTGTDTDNPSKPGEGTDTGADSSSLIGQIIALLKNFFDSPSDFKLDFDGFKNLILPERFPFCIPFDMVKAVKLFAADAADFEFSIDLDTQYFAIHHTVDLTPYALPIAFFRYGCVIWFVWILISRTHDLIKW